MGACFDYLSLARQLGKDSLTVSLMEMQRQAPLTAHSCCPTGSSYFFKGTEYWQLQDSAMEVEPGFPRSVGRDWLLCTDMQSDSPATEPNVTERTHPRARNHADHAESSYEVCSCTSDSATALSSCSFGPPLSLLVTLCATLLTLLL